MSEGFNLSFISLRKLISAYRHWSNRPDQPSELPHYSRNTRIRQTFSPFPRFYQKGSITVEAALVLPVIFMVLVGFIFFFQVQTVQLRLQGVTDEVCGEVAEFYHLETVLPDVFNGGETEEGSELLVSAIKKYAGNLIYSGISDVYLKNRLYSIVSKKWLDGTCISGGGAGIKTSVSMRYGDATYVVTKLTYSVSLPFMPEKILSMELTNQSMKRTWTGIAREETSEEGKYYKTKYGTVYHIYRDCSYLKRSIKSVSSSQVKAKKNSEGQHYKACSLCIHGSTNAIVYITSDGERYHNSSTCSSLKRYVQEISKSEVGSLGLCSACAARKAKEKDND